MSTQWPHDRAAALLAALGERGLSIPRPIAEQLITDRVDLVAAAMGVSPATAQTYLTDEVIADIAHDMASSLAGEGPGIDLFEAARTAALPIEDLGRLIAGLAEATLLELTAAGDLDQAARCLSTLGTLIADGTPPGGGANPAPITLPPQLLHRAARYLDTAAASADQGSAPSDYRGDTAALAEAFRRDAHQLRVHAGQDTPPDPEEGTPPLRLM